MTSYIIRRLLLVIPTLFIVSLTIFIVVRLVPGDTIDLMINQHAAGLTKEVQKDMRDYLAKTLGLDVPIYVQFGRWIKGIVLHGDLGNSLWKQTPVSDELVQKIPVSFELGIIGLIVAMLISFPIGIYSAIRQDTIGDYLGRSFAIAFISVPSFWLGTMVVVFPSIWWGWSPPLMPISFREDPMGNLSQFVLPGAILGMSMCGVNMRYIRTMMLEVLRQDYIRTAWSKGLRERTVVVRHALKNALIPVITLLGLSVPVLVGGTVILETIFNLPGMGRLLVSSAMVRDYTIISGVSLTIAVVVVLINLCVDLLYGALDPRIRYR
jgi:peptide/nickel transport system permease protein